MDNIILRDSGSTHVLNDYSTITESTKLFNKQIKRTLRRKAYSTWSESYKIFSLSFDKIIATNYLILIELVKIPDTSTGKIFTLRTVDYNVIITEDTISFKEEWSPVLNTYLYTGTITLEESCI